MGSVAVLLIVLNAMNSPEFVMPMPGRDVCFLNQASMNRMLENGKGHAECFDLSVQAFVIDQHARPLPPLESAPPADDGKVD